ncbi:mRNA cleavage and polyadenylation factor CLP1 P-loop, putative [Angomonas deanei]|uniref:mRNA cleavage and polyadenylation factor CLP1 P-loop, putative n=1 Tax=Angomonas deanei TaxID=59799 RepID=A0A7G2CH68_9TRYP|nr:mRNA cleavage and polyadenylation factor CLP1 P-loop, putative [Angomonas deanei]
MPAVQPQQHESLSVGRCTLNLYFRAGSLVLHQGSASIFNSNVKQNVKYTFENCSIPVVVTSTARLDVEGEFTYSETILSSDVFNLHCILDTVRANAALLYKQTYPDGYDGTHAMDTAVALRGPRVIVIGDQNTGKSSLCRSLINLAVKAESESKVVFVDLDIGQQSVSCPGSLSAAFMESQIPIDEGLNAVMPLTFFFGDITVSVQSRKRYLDACAVLCDAVNSVLERDEGFGNGGLIINTMGWITNLGKDLLMELCSIFSVTHIVVTGSDSDLETAAKTATTLQSGVEVLRFPRITTLMKRGGTSLANSRTSQLVRYFSGTTRTPLSPCRAVVKVADVFFFNAVTLQPMTWKEVPANSLAAVVWCDSEDQLAETNVAGYIVLLEVGKQYVSFLAPASGDLPKPYILVSPTLKLPVSKVPPINMH